MLALLFVIPWVTEYGLKKKQQQKFYRPTVKKFTKTAVHMKK